MKLEELEQLTQNACADAASAENSDALEQVRIRYLGRKGRLPEIMAALKTVAPEDRPAFGKAANRFKVNLQEAIQTRKASLSSEPLPSDAFDVTLPGSWPELGTAHPIRRIQSDMVSIFRRIGFTVALGPDIDTVAHNFDALNTPADHPSRDARDTFYLDPQHLLRTHTSPVQVRHMLSNKPPVRIVCPGRAYRRDTPDATHSANFHQLEGLYVDEKVSMADLKGTLDHFAREILGPNTKVRFRPHFFPFTEPSVEVDFTCHVCKGKGCRVCRNSGWIEIAGAGMVDPHVFEAVGYDPEEVSGFAFGMGIERIAMILFEIDDIRRLYENDIRFLRQFA